MAAAAIPAPVIRQRNVILAALLILAAGAWALLALQSMMMDDHEMGLTMGMAAPLFLGVWVVMMVAMMFPTAAPMVLAFSRAQANKRTRSGAYVPTWVFLTAYLLIWTLAGGGAFALAWGLEQAAMESMWLMDHAARLGGVVLIGAGVYQLSPLKRKCLSRCRTPMSFILTSWREGRVGAFRMGLHHGLLCLGCCWLLFAILFPLGVMNVAAMALVTLLIFAEKSLAVGARVSQVAAAALVAYGAVVLAVPSALPTAM